MSAKVMFVSYFHMSQIQAFGWSWFSASQNHSVGNEVEWDGRCLREDHDKLIPILVKKRWLWILFLLLDELEILKGRFRDVGSVTAVSIKREMEGVS